MTTMEPPEPDNVPEPEEPDADPRPDTGDDDDNGYGDEERNG